jgi:carboxymethylenebutenolidase
LDQRIIDHYLDYVHVHFDRRLFLERTARLVGSATAAGALLPLLQSNYAHAETVPEDDARIAVRRISFAGPGGIAEKAYLAEPRSAGRHSAVVVLHQNTGINAQIEDMARRLAAEGYVGLAVDMLSPFGGTPPDRDAAGRLIAQVTRANAAAQAIAGVNYLRTRADASGKVGVLGFCWGGNAANEVAVEEPALDAAAVYYGVPPALEQVPKIRAPLLLHYADAMLDPRVGDQVPGYEAGLKAAHKVYALYWYAGANHGFNDNANPARYHEGAAKLAWSRTLDWFKTYL